MTSGEKLCREALTVLRAQLPTSMPVILRFYDENNGPPGLSHDEGYCQRKPKTYVIGIKRDKCRNCMLSAFVHEYAHARAWGAVQAETSDHDGHFGLELAAVFRAFYRAA